MTKLITVFFVSFGVVMGGAILGGLSATLVKQAPLYTMQRIAEEIKFWAIIASIGGTFEALRGLEEGFSELGNISIAVKQVIYILSAFGGAQLATFIIQILVEGTKTP